VKFYPKTLLPILFLLAQISLPRLCATERLETLKIARGFVGVKEDLGNNRGHWVNRFLLSAKSKPGNQWCAAFVAFCLDSARVKSLLTRSALARSYVRPNSVKATRVISENMVIPPGSILIWRRGNTMFGHVGFVVEWRGKSGTTVEGNTSSGLKGSQNDGDGVYMRKRTINPYSYFRITDFTIYD
jgi:hypothetical protein